MNREDPEACHGKHEVTFFPARNKFFSKAIAVTAMLIIAAGATYDIKTAPPIYSDGATVIFFVGRQLSGSAAGTPLTQSLITTEVMLAQTTAGAAGRIRIEAIPCNRSNLQYPDYAEQCATLTATAASPGAARQAFWLAYRGLLSRLKTLQVSAGAAPRSRIRASLAGISGPVA